MEIIFGVTVVLLSVAGAVSLIRWAAMKLLTPSDKNGRVYAVLLSGDNADIELQMAIDLAEWLPIFKKGILCAVDCGLEKEQAVSCARLCKGTEFRFITKRELSDKLL